MLYKLIIKQSREYLNNYVDWRDQKIERLIEELEKKEEELVAKRDPNPDENLFYPDGTFLRSYGWNVEMIEHVPQGLPLWVMQEGMKRELSIHDLPVLFSTLIIPVAVPSDITIFPIPVSPIEGDTSVLTPIVPAVPLV